MDMFKMLFISLLSLSLLACDDKSIFTSKQEKIYDFQEVYDFRDEKYQDFYSKFARELERKSDLNVSVERNGFDKTFDKEYINEVLGLDIQEEIYFNLHVTRVEPSFYKYKNEYNHFSDENDVLAAYRENEFKTGAINKISKYEVCGDNFQIEGLFCLNSISKNKIKYYYLPKKSTKTIPYVNQSLGFFCDKLQNNSPDEQIICTFFNFSDQPYNIDIWIDFRKPENFFKIIEYTEKYIHHVTGEHI